MHSSSRSTALVVEKPLKSSSPVMKWAHKLFLPSSFLVCATCTSSPFILMDERWKRNNFLHSQHPNCSSLVDHSIDSFSPFLRFLPLVFGSFPFWVVARSLIVLLHSCFHSLFNHPYTSSPFCLHLTITRTVIVKNLTLRDSKILFLANLGTLYLYRLQTTCKTMIADKA